MRPYLLAFVVCAAFACPARAAAPGFPDDAALHAVQFLDADVGWAVGDDGVVLKTIDGGKTWELQTTNVHGSLKSIHMLTHMAGWVVGRDELPGKLGSAGIVLYTRDGGETWHRMLQGSVPGLNHVRFGDANTGYLVGDGNDLYPTGVLLTTDAGKTWHPVKGPRCTSWLGGDFFDGKTAALAGTWSQFGTLRDGSLGKADVDAFGGRNIRSIVLRESKSFAVGQGGLVLKSQTFGAGWAFVTEIGVSQDLLAAWDFHAVTCVGSRVCVVGRPGSAVLLSDDRGATWKMCKTGHPLPLNGVHFFDDKRGWAVGEFGAILATGDGGQTWSVQRTGGKRAAILYVQARAQDLPVDSIAKFGGEQGWLMAALRFTGPDPKSESFAEAAQAQRIAASSRAAGGGAGEMLWQFPLPQHLINANKTDLLSFWDRLHGNRAAQQMLRQLVLSIRMWRPDVVVSDNPDDNVTGCAASCLVAEALHTAFQQAADPTAFPEQIEQLGLEPWRVSKVYGLWNKQDSADLVSDTSHESARLEATYAEYATRAISLVADNLQVPPLRCYRLLDSTQPKTGTEHDLLDGVTLVGGTGVCRRDLPALAEPDEKRVAALKALRPVLNLSKNPGNGMANPAQLLAQIAPLCAKLPDDRGAKAIYAIATDFAKQGEWELARDTYFLMIERYPAHPLSLDACRWLIRHNSSSEARRRHELGQFLVVGQEWKKSAAPFGLDPREGLLPPVKGDPKTGSIKLDEAQQLTFLGDPTTLRHWHEGSLLLNKRLMGFGPLYANDPSIQFCVQASNRQLAHAKEAQDFYTAICGEYEEGPWREAAAQELWLTARRGLPPRTVALCRGAREKPFLDGKFDDACWRECKPIVLQNAVNDTTKECPTEVKLAYDSKFLYIALKCQHPAGQGVPPVKVRQRDADLRGFDRVSILLDLDRDYSTFYRFEIDQRGCLCEDCWGDKKWNPQWFVAIHSEEDCWQIEAAIPLLELTGERVMEGTAWACNIVRVLPGRGVQALSTPAGVEPRPEGMTLLMFQQPPAPANLPPSKGATSSPQKN